MTDQLLLENVKDALQWDPRADGADIAVTVDKGVVTLRGRVRTYAQKVAVERTALAVYGVNAVANDLDVHIGPQQIKTDTEIAKAALAALRWSSPVPDDAIDVAVADGWVTLSGKVQWDYQRSAAARAVGDLMGVRGVTNAIELEPHARASEVKTQIEAALKRSAEVDARRINVVTYDGKVTLSGNVHSWFERDQARRAAWSAPGVTQVEDHLAIVP